MCCTAKEVGFDDWKEADTTKLLQSHKLEVLYEQLLSYMKSMALFQRLQRYAHICDDECVPVRDVREDYLMWNFITI